MLIYLLKFEITLISESGYCLFFSDEIRFKRKSRIIKIKQINQENHKEREKSGRRLYFLEEIDIACLPLSARLSNFILFCYGVSQYDSGLQFSCINFIIARIIGINLDSSLGLGFLISDDVMFPTDF